ncbi:tetratricopeptide repeat protein [Lusitaniella coriacea LEGE 07157]|uniref:Tetratricopeptide repeat protein n=1 Tax=Lusitaniella coriacea LEGE 07157 TaxID=945747 RepID=A0A8J7E0W0_9CYAN|nr:CHAT domain-containing tetratricopeptide repeat protein [Lusitaniella coriacea]MBE9117251.1 tetratricopeptide repeat protein [Lusitaniella coriacea LEGE 07157]
MKQFLGVRLIQRGVSLKSIPLTRLRGLGLALTTILWFWAEAPLMALEEITEGERLDSRSNILASYNQQDFGSHIFFGKEASASDVLQAEAERLFKQGVRQYRASQYREALQFFQQALPIFRQVRDRVGEATTLNGIGLVYNTIEQPQQALGYFNQALIVVRQVGEQVWEADTLNNLGGVYQTIGQPQQALGYFNQALSIYKAVDNRSGEATTLNNIGGVYQTIEQPQQALNYYNKALPILRQVRDRSGEATTLNNIGVVYQAIGQPQQALNYYKQALPIRREVRNRTGEADTLNNMGVVYQAIGQPQQALDYFNQALPIYREVGNRAGEATSFNNMGEVYRVIGQPQQALGYYTQALPILREVENRRGEAATLNNLALIYQAIGQPQQALDYFNQALPIYREVGNRAGEATSFNNMGEVYRVIGQPQQALDYYTQALTIFRQVGARTREAASLNNTGAIYADLGQPQQALNYYNQALNISKQAGIRLGEAASLNNIGEVYQVIGQPQQALDYYTQALTISRQVGERGREATALNNIGFLYENQGNTTQAIDFYQRSIEGTESIQSEIQIEELKSSFASGQINTYDRLINLLWNQGDFETAFNYVERAKARAFLDQFANAQIDIRAGADSPLLERERDLQIQIAALRQQLLELRNKPQNQWDEETIEEVTTQIETLQKEYENLLTQLKLQSQETAELVSVDVASLAEIQNLLDDDTTLVEYFVTEERTLAFIITHNSFQTVPLEVGKEQLTKELKLFYDFSRLNNPHPAELKQLHQWLIAPLLPYLKTSQLSIVPHSILHYLPFAALTDGQTYLSDTFILSKLPSASTLRYLPEKRKPKTDTLLALGNPTISEPLGILHYAKQEAETVARLFNTDALTDKGATESAVRLQSQQAGILHLAAHGQYNPLAPLFSTLHLASDAQNDGRLEVHEIYGLDLTAATNLVVLSACQTNLGELSRGDEVVALNRAFLYAGTPTVMASLWNVDDKATGLLMERFYTYLKAGMGKAEALQQAQKDIRSQFPHPYYWAAFSITGDGE